MMNSYPNQSFSQQLVAKQSGQLEGSLLDRLSCAIRDNLYPEVTFLPDNGMQLIQWLECLPREILDSHPRFGLIYIHVLLFVQQYEQARQQLQVVERSLQSWTSSEKESIQAEIASVRTYLMMHQDLTARCRETFYNLTRSVLAKTVETGLPFKASSDADLFIVPEPLSKRELEVLGYIAGGMSNQEIADALVVTVGTVKRHINNIYNKLNVHSRTQAVRYAQAHNLLPML
ncbi:MAG TPA: helix-turn-helix transcriptional regulator [Ktedonosporobacter sp.]|jgi:ATP/maltotriose-dependent transcriptional regulator MalT|nr:helix-turn-helix transcriptional regulator [Ktedonosporobacter sp.]